MHEELIQFNSGDHVLGNKNVTEAVSTNGDIVFNCLLYTSRCV